MNWPTYYKPTAQHLRQHPRKLHSNWSMGPSRKYGGLQLLYEPTMTLMVKIDDSTYIWRMSERTKLELGWRSTSRKCVTPTIDKYSLVHSK